MSRLFSSGALWSNLSQITGYLAAGLVFTTSAVNALVYSPEGSDEAAAAGFILLSMVAVRIQCSSAHGSRLTPTGRSFGCFISVPLLKQPIAATLIHLRSIKTDIHILRQLLTSTLTPLIDHRPLYRIHNHHKCIRRRN